MEKEKQGKPRNLKILKYLPKAAAAVSFQNPPFSPGRDKRSDNAGKLKAHAGKGYSGQIVSIIPDAARRKAKNETFEETQEPTSPKVSCMGQIKSKHKKKTAVHKTKTPKKTLSLPQDVKPVKRHASRFGKLFSGTKSAKQTEAYSDDEAARVEDKPAPGLGQMRKFASGRDTFANFDWVAQIAPLESHQRDYHSDVERGESDDDYDDEEDDDVIIPYSAPIMAGGKGVDLQPRKEINLWKRRTMDPPRPLKLKSTVRSAN